MDWTSSRLEKCPILAANVVNRRERIAPEDEYFISRELCPNVYCYSCIIDQAMGLPMVMLSVMFVIPRRYVGSHSGRRLSPTRNKKSRLHAKSLMATHAASCQPSNGPAPKCVGVKKTRRAATEMAWLFPLRPEIHGHSVRAGLGSSVTHLIHEASLAGSAGGIVIRTIVWRCRDHISIAVDVHVG
jgi:Citrate synthase, C-terminal domain